MATLKSLLNLVASSQAVSVVCLVLALVFLVYGLYFPTSSPVSCLWKVDILDSCCNSGVFVYFFSPGLLLLFAFLFSDWLY